MKKYILSVTCIGIIMGSAALAAGLSYMLKKTGGGGGYVAAAEYGEGQAAEPGEPEEAAPPPDPVRIRPSTRVIYEYYYPDGDKLETSEEDPPYFLLGLSRGKIREYYEGWDILEFNEERVKIRRTLPGYDGEEFVVGVKDNCVAVFERSTSGLVSLKEKTSTPVTALSREEQDKLRGGIAIAGEDQLAQMLEDYGS